MALVQFVWRDPLIRAMVCGVIAVVLIAAMPLYGPGAMIAAMLGLVLFGGTAVTSIAQYFGWRPKEHHEMTEQEKKDDYDLYGW